MQRAALYRLRLAFGERTFVKEHQQVAAVAVVHAQYIQYAPRARPHGQLLAQLALQRRFRALARFQLAAGELPQKPQALALWPLAEQHAPIPAHHASHHCNHAPASCFSSQASTSPYTACLPVSLSISWRMPG